MLVELTSIPGGGKTTLHRHLIKAMKGRGLSFTDLSKIAKREPQPKSVPRYVIAKPQRELLYRFTQFSHKYPALINAISELYSQETTKCFLYYLMASNFQMASELKRVGEIVLIDEGFLTHGVAAYLASKKEGLLQDLIQLSPPIDAVIFVNTPPDVAFNRAVERRGGTPIMRKKVIAKFGDLTSFEERYKTLKQGLEYYKSSCRDVIEVDGTHDAERSANMVVERLVGVMTRSGV